MKIYIEPTPGNAPPSNGIGRVVHAQFEHLPKLGIEIVKTYRKADVIASHVEQFNLPRVDVLHSHGLYFDDIPNAGYDAWQYTANAHIAQAVRRAKILTVPAPWVAMPFKRDMHLSPWIVPHGIDFADWNPGENRGYLFWNKGRANDVCDPVPAWELAEAGLPVVSTFNPLNRPTGKLKVVGAQSFEKMRLLIQSADIYLATTPETFGIGTLEAMACGLPVLGYRWGGTADIVQHMETGYLVEPGDVNGLKIGYQWLKANREAVGAAAREFAGRFDWPNVIGEYAKVYQAAISIPDEKTVAVGIISYNYAQYLPKAIESVLAQSRAPNEIVVIDDGSTDNTAEVVSRYADRVRYIRQENQGVAAARMNAIAATKSDFLTLLDADDWLEPSFVLAMERALVADRGLGIAYAGFMSCNSEGKKSGTVYGTPFDWEIQARGGVPPATAVPTPSACMFRRRMFERAGSKIYQEFAPGEDAEFWARGLSTGFTAQLVTSEALTNYRMHAEGASKKRKYVRVDTWLPWMRDKIYPFAAPVKSQIRVRSYMLPRVSVIIPVGPGHEKLLLDAVRSLEGQSERLWELIVVADTDLPETDIRTVYPFATVVPGRRLGAGAARNDGLKEARGTFVVFLDADDYLHPEALEKLLAAYDQSGYVYSDWYAVTGASAEVKELKEYDPNSDNLQHAVTVLMPTVWAKRLKFDESLPAWEDVEYYNQARSLGFCGKRVAEPLLYYRLETGKRRAAALKEKKKLAAYIEKRQKARHIMACGSCPSPAGGVIMKAKKELNPMGNQTEPIASPQDGVVRMIYTGGGRGVRTYIANKRTYRAGDSDGSRAINAHPADVERLRALGFEVVARPLPQAQPLVTAPIPAPEPALAPAPMPTPAVEKTVVTAKPMATNAHVPAPAVTPVKKQAPKPADPLPIPEEVTEIPPMPETVRGLRAAIAAGVGESVIRSWEYDERAKGDSARKEYLKILRQAKQGA